jgi:hypothetical protein
MSQNPRTIDIAIESGSKKTFAGAVEWPGWSRTGKDEASAIQALFDYGPRYARAMRAAKFEFRPPENPQAFEITERLAGTTTTDFGAPDAALADNMLPVDEAELARYQSILEACWGALDEAARSAAGKELRKGPRGGGRETDEIVRHTLEAHAAYLGRIGVKLPPGADLSVMRQISSQALTAAAHGELPTHGPRGGAYWTPRYFVRRAAWHILDHAWEIEDRAG